MRPDGLRKGEMVFGYGGIVNGGNMVDDATNKTWTQLREQETIWAVAVTRYNTNGWVFWEYFDDKAQEWKTLDELRKQA